METTLVILWSVIFGMALVKIWDVLKERFFGIKKSKSYMSNDGWYDLELSSEVRMRIYTDGVYFQAHDGIPRNYILDEGTFESDGLNFIRYNIYRTRDQYMLSMYKKSLKCECAGCVEYRESYVKKYGKPEEIK